MTVITRNDTAERLMKRIFANDESSTKSCLNWVFRDEFGTVLRSTHRPIDVTMKTGRQITRQIFGIATADRPPVWLRLSTRLVREGQNNRPRVIAILAEATVDAASTSALQSAAVVMAIIKSQAVAEFNIDGTIVWANEQFLKPLGYSLSEVQGRHHRMFVDPLERKSKDFWSRLRREEYRAAEYRRIGKNGREVWLQATYNPILDLNGCPYKIIKFAIDITDRKRLEADFYYKSKLLRQLSITDGLTGLYNRGHIDEVIRMEIARAHRYETPLTIALFDIDHFKRINDQMGHAFGDDVLKAAALALKLALRETDIIARYGGEEFLAVLPLTTLHEAISALSRVKIIIATRVTSGLPHPVTVSAGVVRYRDGETMLDFVNRAENLLYEAKREGRDRFAFSEDIETE